MSKRHLILRCWTFLFLCTFYVYSNEVQVGDYKVNYTIPNKAIPIDNDQPNMLGAWEIPGFSNVFTIQAFNLPTGLNVIESDISEGMEEAIGAKIQSFKNFKTSHLIFREGTASAPITNSSMIYLAYWWADGICLKFQGMYLKENENASIEEFRSIISTIGISSQNSAPLAKSSKPMNLDPHEISKLLGKISFCILAIVAILFFLKKHKRKNI